MEVRVGQITKPTGAAPATVDTDLGTTPRIIFFCGSSDTANGNTSGMAAQFGVAVHRPSGVQEASISGAATDASINGARYNSSGKAVSDAATGSTEYLADCTFLFANHGGETINGFRLTFTTNNAEADLINYIAICGDDILDAQITTFDVNTSGPGTYAVGFDFWPDAVVFFSDCQNTQDNRSDDGPSFNVTWWTKDKTDANGVGLGIDDTDATPMYIGYAASSAGSLAGIVTADATGNLNLIAGVTLDTAAPGVSVAEFAAATSAHKVYAVGISGGKWGTVRQAGPAAAGSQSITGMGFRPRGVMALGAINSVNATSGDKLHCRGFSNFSSHVSASAVVETRVSGASADTARSQTATELLRFISNVPATQASVTPTSADTDGLTVTWGTAGGTTRQVHYLCMADGPIYNEDY